jgi:aldehyde:ferredoxin oxidoreductase
VTGLDLDEDGLNRYGERIFNLQRAILLREGRRPKRDDVLAPFNYTDPVQSVFMNPEVIVPGSGDSVVSKKGATLDPDAFQAMRQEFYRLRGWDAATGCQRRTLLEALQLDDVADAVAALGYLGD